MILPADAVEAAICRAFVTSDVPGAVRGTGARGGLG